MPNTMIQEKLYETSQYPRTRKSHFRVEICETTLEPPGDVHVLPEEHAVHEIWISEGARPIFGPVAAGDEDEEAPVGPDPLVW